MQLLGQRLEIDVAPPADSILDQLPAPVLVVGRDGTVRRGNDAAGLLFGSVDPLGLDWRCLLGLIGASPDAALGRAIASGLADSARVSLPENRVLDCRVQPLREGGTALVFTDITGYVRDAERASRDSLTGLANRAGFAAALARAAGRTARGGATAAVLCVDLDRFKAVNDTLGHAVGDALLCRVAARLSSAAGPDAVVARLGGDEFAILQGGAEQPGTALALAERLVDLIGRTYVLQGHMINVGASVGVALARPDWADPDLLLARADIALYRSKADGRGRFRVFDDSMDEQLQARRSLELDLRRALALRQFELVYQPQVHLGTHAIVGFEALLRWSHPVRGPVSPAEFIPLAEEIGIIVPIGEWVLRTACNEAKSWPDDVSVAVNLSPVQFRAGRLVDTILSALANAGLAPSRLELEITEGTLLEDTDGVLAALQALRALGVRISMDDFGTGYSSLSYLQKFPFDKIKIDQSFVRGMEDNAECGAIVRAIASLGASLGVRTTAEGVETKAQLARIRSEGCNEVQGFLTGRPVRPEAVTALLSSRG